jgi:HlyD family secretion protein
MIIGFGALALLICGFGAWAVMASISSAVVASGQIVVDRNRQVIQHPDGGVVHEILVKEGDHVTAGDLVIRLDPSLLRSELAIVEGRLVELLARRGRLEAERDEAKDITFAPELLVMAEADQEIDHQLAGQKRLFEARNTSVEQEIEQLRKRRDQLHNQVDGIEAQLSALEQQNDLILEELKSQKSLFDKGLAQASRILGLRREEARMAGELGNLIARKSEALERVAELEIEELKLKTRRREDAITELRDLQYNELELKEQRRSLLERLNRLDLRAPVSGLIYDLRVFGKDAVIRAADPVLYVVPQDRPLVIEAEIQSIDIDQVYENQPVVLKFGAFDSRTTPELDGLVKGISADAFVDDQTGAPYYRIEIHLPEGELNKLPEDVALLPGMPVDSFIRTGEQSPLAYLARPLASYFNKALREN